jgi:hypothetical protein
LVHKVHKDRLVHKDRWDREELVHKVHKVQSGHKVLKAIQVQQAR